MRLSSHFFWLTRRLLHLDRRMSSVVATSRIAFAACRRSRLEVLVGLAIALVVLSPCALQGFSLLRAAQYETNENRSECETNEGIAMAVHSPTRITRGKGRPAEKPPCNLQSPSERCAMVRTIAATRHLTPPVVNWSPSMRC